MKAFVRVPTKYKPPSQICCAKKFPIADEYILKNRPNVLLNTIDEFYFNPS